MPVVVLGGTLLLAAPYGMAGSGPKAAPEKSMDSDCLSLLSQGNGLKAFQLARAQLMAQGLQLIPQACPYVRVAPGKMQQVLDVRVVVKDSETASQFVRGPLADGEEVDMGGVHLALPSLALGSHEAQAEDVSPDVLHNRAWLASVMEARGLQSVAGHWWAFVPVSTTK